MTSVQVEGFIKEKHPFVAAYFNCRQLKLSGVAKFLIDTGSTRTTILEGDAEKLGINFKGLKKAEPVQRCGGKQYPYMLPESLIVFEGKGGKLCPERLDEVDAIKPERGRLKPDFSILGIDIIRRFDFTWDRDGKPILKR